MDDLRRPAMRSSSSSFGLNASWASSMVGDAERGDGLPLPSTGDGGIINGIDWAALFGRLNAAKSGELYGRRLYRFYMCDVENGIGEVFLFFFCVYCSFVYKFDCVNNYFSSIFSFFICCWISVVLLLDMTRVHNRIPGR